MKLYFFDHFVKFNGLLKNNRIILLLDNYESHTSIAIIPMSKDNRVTLVKFNFCTSHKMQLLSPFTSKCSTSTKEWVITPRNVEIFAGIYDIANVVDSKLVG